MPWLEADDLYQVAVLWTPAASGLRDDYGNPIVGTPGVEISVRWNDKHRLATDKDGNSYAVDATAVVDQDIPLESILWLGALDDIPGTGFVPASGLMQVKVFDSTADIKNRFRRREVFMLRYNNVLPVGQG